MKTILKRILVGPMLLLSAAACADLDVVNPNDADAARALQSADDVEALIAGAYNSWHSGWGSSGGPSLFMSNTSFQHTAPWANFGMEQYARIPRIPIVNQTADGYYSYFTRPWRYSYRALSAVADGFRALDNDPALVEALGDSRARRARAFGRLVQGLATAEIAAMYDRGWVIDENVDPKDPGDPLEPQALMDVASGYFGEAISLAGQGSFDIPVGWMSRATDAAELARFAHSMRARYLAATPRSPSDAVDWGKVVADIDAGITEDFVYLASSDNGWFNAGAYYANRPGWSEVPYYIWGMADQSGRYQNWLALSVNDKHPIIDGVPTLIDTPDLRFPQGETVEEQMANPGTRLGVPSDILSMWARPDRGTWRWSYYRLVVNLPYFNSGAEIDLPLISTREMALLKAEALLESNQAAAAAAIINETRTANGLSATDAAGTNADCVPRLPDGQCGDLFELYKWERRLETINMGPIGVGFYFDSRRWGDLYKGTWLQFPAPCQDMEILSLSCDSYGGVGGAGASLGSSYSYPDGG